MKGCFKVFQINTNFDLDLCITVYTSVLSSGNVKLIVKDNTNYVPHEIRTVASKIILKICISS